MILFRADANEKIGVGHVMRCKAIATELKKSGEECAFVTAEKEMTCAEPFSVYSLQNCSGWPDSSEPEVFGALLRKMRAKAVVIDSYSITSEYFKALKNLSCDIPLIYLDDFMQTAWPVDCVINYNIYAQKQNYERLYRNQKTRFCLGPQYAPLRPEFIDLQPIAIKPEIENVLLMTGGADGENICGKVLVELEKQTDPWRNICFHFVVGRYNLYAKQLQKRVKMMPNMVLHENVIAISELMLRCDAAISAAGSTLYELCACGVPTISYAIADNQLQGAAAFAEKGIIPTVGDCRRAGDMTGAILLGNLRKHCASYEQRSKIAKNMKTTVDGNGTKRLTGQIRGMVE